MISMLHWMREVRNSCAHNERVYGMKRENAKVKRPFEIWLKGRKSYISKHDGQRIIDLIIYLRYFLPDNEYEMFIGEIENLLNELKNKINRNVFAQVRAELGLRDMNDLIILKSSQKEIEYNKF